MSLAHVYFRKLAYQEFRRCTTCGFVARGKNSHVEHANSIHKDES